MGELILKQSIAKGFFPKFTFYKKEVLDISGSSSKISLEDINEKADIKFLPEVLLASQFGNSQQNIQNIVMNSENPNNFGSLVTKTSYGGGIYVKDLKLYINSSSPLSIEMDIKIGNNAYTIPNILGPAPVLPDGNIDTILCNKGIDLNSIHKNRILLLI